MIQALLIIIFIIFTFPRSIELVPEINFVLKILKILCAIILLFLSIKNKIKISSFSKILFLLSTFIAISTFINGRPLLYIIKIYGMAISASLLCENILFYKKRKKIIDFALKYIFAILIINLLAIIISIMIGAKGFFAKNTFLLGQDNRFILYILLGLTLSALQLRITNKRKKFLYTILIYVVGLASVIITWSLSAILTLLLIGIISTVLFMINYYSKNNHTVKKVNLSIIFLILSIILSTGLVFFRINNILATNEIKSITKKDLSSISYRTYIWDAAIDELNNHPDHYIYGFGVFDTTGFLAEKINQRAAQVNQLHNILINELFFSGIFGLILYFLLLRKVAKNIQKIGKYSWLFSVLFFGILTQLLFDTFEAYQIYYILLSLLALSASIIEKEFAKKETEDTESIKISNDRSVGIILATYNGEKYLEQQLQSIVQQNYKNWIILASDDHSTDNTFQILKDFEKKYPKKIKVIKNNSKKNGPNHNFANCFKEISTCDYYAFCDQDDLWEKDRLMNLVKYAEYKNDDAKSPLLIYNDAIVTNKDLDVANSSLIHSENKIIARDNQLKKILVQCYAPGCSMFFNDALKQKVKVIYEEAEMHDWWIMLVASLSNGVFFFDKPLIKYRQHENNVTGSIKKENAVIKIKKLLSGRSNTIWKNYQQKVTLQAQEIKNKYQNMDKKSEQILNRFLNAMNTKNRIIRLLKLMAWGFYPIKSIRILRLVL